MIVADRGDGFSEGVRWEADDGVKTKEVGGGGYIFLTIIDTDGI